MIKNPSKFEAKQSKFWLRKFWGNIVVNIEANYRKDRIKTGGAYSIW